MDSSQGKVVERIEQGHLRKHRKNHGDGKPFPMRSFTGFKCFPMMAMGSKIMRIIALRTTLDKIPQIPVQENGTIPP